MIERNDDVEIRKYAAYFIGVIFFLLPSLLFSVWTENNLEWLLTYLKGEYIDVPYLLALILTILLNWIIILINVILELVKLFIA